MARRLAADRLLVALVVGAGLALAGAPAAAADPVGTVVLHIDGAAPQVVVLRVSDYDVHDVDYRVTGGGPAFDETHSGRSVRSLLLGSGVAVGAATSAEVVGAHGTSMALQSGDLADPSDFEGGLVPLLWLNGSDVYGLRPLRDAADVNGGDQPESARDRPLDVYVHTGPRIAVTATLSESSAHVGEAIAASASTDRACADGSRPQLGWDFGDTATAAGAQASHAYGTSGSYSVVATADCADGAGGVSRPQTVTVGAPAPAAPGHGRRGGGDRTKRSAPKTGPRQSAGHRSGAAPSGARPSPGSTRGARRSRPDTPTGSPAPTASPSAGAAPSWPAARPAHRHHAHRAGRRATHRHRSRPARPAAHGRLVHGRLLSDVRPVRVSSLAAARPPVAATAPAARAPQAASPLGALGGAAAVLALVGAGAGGERRRRRHTHPRGAS